MTALRYVYALCRPFGAALQVQPAGVGGDPPRMLHHRGLVAVVGHVPEEDFAEALSTASGAEAVERAHQQVVDALTAVTTPLPFRAGVVFRDDSAVRVMMERCEASFWDTLERLEGCVEWRVRVFDATWELAGRDVVDDFAARLHRDLADRADEERLRVPPEEERPERSEDGAERTALDAAYLVSRTASEGFVEHVRRAARDVRGGRVWLTGPWAAYDFAQDDGPWRDADPVPGMGEGGEANDG
ncbi:MULTISPECIES: GvpL/GvpF family gas vesicle protein [unclassified Streptomyces]|uniref:GvpL/GvpF family gas vesicle protein n=1 Tax=unclassified Streptomyces TaxID=2593676 RepID=UPI001905E7E9|nr:GvpL/GvpF family gas vesicle protein [Streptomyces sp. HSG2]